MKKIVLFVVALVFGLFLTELNAQNVSITGDGSDPHPSAMLDIKADTMGILIPRISLANRPVSPATGLLIYQTDNGPGFYYFDGTTWQKVENFDQLETLIEAETTAREDADSDIQDELDATQAGAGLGTVGTYTPNNLANYISDAVSLKDADNKLDAQIKTNTDDIAGLETVTTGLGTMATQDADDVGITGGDIDNTAIGATTASTGAFTTLETSDDATINGDLYVGQSAKSNTSNATVTGTLTAGDVETPGSVIIQAVPDNNAASGLTSKVTVDENTVGFGAALFVASDGNYELANATDITQMPCVALAIETGTGLKEIIHQGYVRNDSWNWTVGGIIYISTTDGVMTQSFPTGTANQVQVVGYATHADRMFFMPNIMLIQLK